MADMVKVREGKIKKKAAGKNKMMSAQEKREKDQKEYRDKEFANIVTPLVKMEDGTMKDVKYLNIFEARALVKELCVHRTEFCLMEAVELIKNHILPAFWKKDKTWPKRAIYKRSCKK